MATLPDKELFQLKLEKIEGAVSNGNCYVCDEEIDFTDGTHYIMWRARLSKPTLNFHLECFRYMLVAFVKFERITSEQEKRNATPIQ